MMSSLAYVNFLCFQKQLRDHLLTVVCDWKLSRPLLCCKLPLFKMFWETLKVVFCCFLSYVLTDMAWGFQVSHFFIIVSKGAAKLWPIKVGSPKRILLRSPLESGPGSSPRFFFLISNFERSKFCSPLSYDSKKGLIWNPQAIPIST